MRLTNDGIKENLDWFDSLRGSRTDSTAVAPETMEEEELEPTRAYGAAALAAEALYAHALEEQFGAPAVAEVVEYSDQIAA